MVNKDEYIGLPCRPKGGQKHYHSAINIITCYKLVRLLCVIQLAASSVPVTPTISQLTNLCKTLAAAISLTSSTHFGARLGAFFY